MVLHGGTHLMAIFHVNSKMLAICTLLWPPSDNAVTCATNKSKSLRQNTLCASVGLKKRESYIAWEVPAGVLLQYPFRGNFGTSSAEKKNTHSKSKQKTLVNLRYECCTQRRLLG